MARGGVSGGGPAHSRELTWHLAQLHQCTEYTRLQKEKKEQERGKRDSLLRKPKPHYTQTRQKEGQALALYLTFISK